MHTRLTTSFGGHSDRVTPVPIPNTEVKPVSADGTWGEIPWESRTPPDFALERRWAYAQRLSSFSALMTAWTVCPVASLRCPLPHPDVVRIVLAAPMRGGEADRTPLEQDPAQAEVRLLVVVGP